MLRKATLRLKERLFDRKFFQDIPMALSSFLYRKLRGLSARVALVVFGLCVLGLVFATSDAAVSFAQTEKEGENTRVMTAGLNPIAPFIGKDTLFVARLDLDRIDYDVFNESLKQIFNRILEKLQFDESGVQACRKEFDATANALTESFRQTIADFKARTGLSDVYYVVQTTRGDGACFIAPAKNMTSEQQEECKKLAEEFRLNCALYQQSYMVASKAPLKEFGARYKDFKPSSNRTLETSIAHNGDKLLSWYCGRLKIRPLFHATLDEGTKSARVRQYDPFSDSPRSVKDLVETFDAAFVEGSGYVDASTLSVQYTLKFTTSVNASKFHDSLVDVVDAYNEFYFKTLENNPSQVDMDDFAPGKFLATMDQTLVKRFNLYGIVREYFAGTFELLLPSQNESELTFTDSVLDEVSKLGPVSVGFLVLGRSLTSSDSKVELENVDSSIIEFDSNAPGEEDAKTPNPFKRVD